MSSRIPSYQHDILSRHCMRKRAFRKTLLFRLPHIL
jgi:hypothetical protein